jgi:hypothetical protein
MSDREHEIESLNQSQSSPESGKKKYKHLWMVEDKHLSDGSPGKSYWTKVGVAFPNRDGSWSLELSAVPVNGRLQMRDPQPRAATIRAAA